MKIEEVKNLSVQERWLYWIKERESIRLKKEAGEDKPWSDDEILQSYRFCNVRRMDDKVSQWLLKNWYEPYFDHPSMLYAVVVARLFNYPESLEEFGFPNLGSKRKYLKKLVKIAEQRKTKGLKNFNGAYIVSTNGLSGDKVSVLAERVLTPFTDAKLPQTTSQELLCGFLTRFWGISTFIGGQVAADVRHAVRGSWSDAKYWAPIGPGSRRGLNRLHGVEKLNQPIDSSKFLASLAELRKILKSTYPKIEKQLEAIDIQNTLCEFDKYERTLFEGRRPKQKYKGTGV